MVGFQCGESSGPGIRPMCVSCFSCRFFTMEPQKPLKRSRKLTITWNNNFRGLVSFCLKLSVLECLKWRLYLFNLFILHWYSPLTMLWGVSRCTAKRPGHTNTWFHSPTDSLHPGCRMDIEQNSLCYTVGPADYPHFKYSNVCMLTPNFITIPLQWGKFNWILQCNVVYLIYLNGIGFFP